MKSYFSGLGFTNEQALFKSYLDRNPLSIAGFSYGAQRALQEAIQRVKRGERVQKLQLLSPAFFNPLPLALKKKELAIFAKNKEAYLNFFYKKVRYPALNLDITPFQVEPTLQELKEVLFFEWRHQDFELLQREGVEIEVYIGELDKIIDAKAAHHFFKEVATSYFIKGVGHLLR